MRHAERWVLIWSLLVILARARIWPPHPWTDSRLLMAGQTDPTIAPGRFRPLGMKNRTATTGTGERRFPWSGPKNRTATVRSSGSGSSGGSSGKSWWGQHTSQLVLTGVALKSFGEQMVPHIPPVGALLVATAMLPSVSTSLVNGLSLTAVGVSVASTIMYERHHRRQRGFNRRFFRDQSPRWALVTG